MPSSSVVARRAGGLDYRQVIGGERRARYVMEALRRLSSGTRRWLDTPDFAGWAEIMCIALPALTPEAIREQMLSSWLAKGL